MGAMGKKMSSFLLTKFTGSYLEIFLNNIIKMWEQFRILEFPWIVLFILIGGIFLISSSDLVSQLSTIVGLHFVSINPVLLCAFVPIKIYSNTEASKDIILKKNKDKSGIYMFKNLTNGKQYIGSAVDLSNRLSFDFSCKSMKNYLKNSQSYIYNAILKHGHSNFSLIILEYCEPEKCI